MNIDYRLLWLFAILFVPFCASDNADELKNELLCVSINDYELTEEICSLRVVLDSAIIRAEVKPIELILVKGSDIPPN